MKGGLAAMMCGAPRPGRPERACASTSSASPTRSPRRSSSAAPTTWSSRATLGDFAITGEPTDLHIGIQAKGVLALRIEVTGTSAHGSTPWVGDNAVLKAIDVFRQIESLPFARESSDLFDRPSINLGRIVGGDAINKVPDLCVIDVDVRYLPGQDADEIQRPRSTRCDARVVKAFHRRPAIVERDEPLRAGARRGDRAGRGARAASRSRSAATAPRTRSPSSTRACPRWSAAPRATATTAPRSGCRSGRSASIGRRWWSS